MERVYVRAQVSKSEQSNWENSGLAFIVNVWDGVIVSSGVGNVRVGLVIDELEGQRMARGLLDALVAPAFAAYCDIAIVAADLYHLSFGDDLAQRVHPRIDDSLTFAGAGRFNLVDRVGYLQKALRPLEEMGSEVGAESVAHHVAAIVIDDAGELIYLTAREELSLVDENPVFHHEGFLESGLGKLIEVGIGINPEATSLNAYSGADHIVAFAIVDDRFHAQVFHATFLKVVGSG